MTRALVLGGGGPVGIGWEAGLIDGLAGAGVMLKEADAVIGTSAGSAVGAHLLSGGAMSEVVTTIKDPRAAGAPDIDLARLTTLLGDAVSSGGTDAEIRRRIGEVALDTWTIPEDTFVARFAVLRGREWPARFACTAVHAGTGASKLWKRESGVDLDRAVASSCAVPTVTEPITIGGARYMDGGIRNSLNADLALGHDLVLAISCMVIEVPPGIHEPMLEGLVASFQASFDTLRDGGALVATIAPGAEFLDISGWGLHLMDFGRVNQAYEAGVRQGAVEADRLGSFWSA